MLWTICVILLVLWALGLATSYTAGGLIHILLAIALVVMVIRLISGTQDYWLAQPYQKRRSGVVAVSPATVPAEQRTSCPRLGQRIAT